eukprot:TRINITY_DN3146_c0_g3_i1.p1 TRINITY_DN3146_c0_g3~~TRINITY_DN3146_c0_g3_i1.p1  ORF type:complete len:206 (-),score=61.14 TRINITY_DN3146_c0_g3_i1:404-1021(-)
MSSNRKSNPPPLLKTTSVATGLSMSPYSRENERRKSGHYKSQSVAAVLAHEVEAPSPTIPPVDHTSSGEEDNPKVRKFKTGTMNYKTLRDFARENREEAKQQLHSFYGGNEIYNDSDGRNFSTNIPQNPLSPSQERKISMTDNDYFIGTKPEIEEVKDDKKDKEEEKKEDNQEEGEDDFIEGLEEVIKDYANDRFNLKTQLENST